MSLYSTLGRALFSGRFWRPVGLQSTPPLPPKPISSRWSIAGQLESPWEEVSLPPAPPRLSERSGVSGWVFLLLKEFSTWSGGGRLPRPTLNGGGQDLTARAISSHNTILCARVPPYRPHQARRLIEPETQQLQNPSSKYITKSVRCLTGAQSTEQGWGWRAKRERGRKWDAESTKANEAAQWSTGVTIL